MRASTVLLCSLALTIGACASHEEVRTAYVGTSSMDQSQVEQLLSQNGFTEVSGLHKNGQDWVGSGYKDGQSVTFDIDRNGTIHSK